MLAKTLGYEQNMKLLDIKKYDFGLVMKKIIYMYIE